MEYSFVITEETFGSTGENIRAIFSVEDEAKARSQFDTDSKSYINQTSPKTRLCLYKRWTNKPCTMQDLLATTDNNVQWKEN